MTGGDGPEVYTEVLTKNMTPYVTTQVNYFNLARKCVCFCLTMVVTTIFIIMNGKILIPFTTIHHILFVSRFLHTLLRKR